MSTARDACNSSTEGQAAADGCDNAKKLPYDFYGGVTSVRLLKSDNPRAREGLAHPRAHGRRLVLCPKRLPHLRFAGLPPSAIPSVYDQTRTADLPGIRSRIRHLRRFILRISNAEQDSSGRS